MRNKIWVSNKLQHKFLERGHTQNENDSIHAAIEHSSRGKSVYTTPQWAATVRDARKKNPYHVVELDSDDFFDFKGLSQAIPNFEFDEDAQKIRWMKIKTVSFDENNYGIVKLTMTLHPLELISVWNAVAQD